MRILFLSNEFPPQNFGGIASCMSVLAPALVERGQEVHLLFCRDDQEACDYGFRGVQVHRRRLLSIRVTERAFGLYGSRWFRTGLTAFIESKRLAIQFDIIEYPNWGADGCMLTLLRSTPTVCMIYTTVGQVLQVTGTESKRSVWWARAPIRALGSSGRGLRRDEF